MDFKMLSDAIVRICMNIFYVFDFAVFDEVHYTLINYITFRVRF